MTLDPRDNPFLNKQQPNAGIPQIPAMPNIPGMPVPTPPAPVPVIPQPASVNVAAPETPAMDFPEPPPSPPMPPSAGVATAITPPKKQKPQVSNTSGTIDTVEAIIIALILALTFRAFLVEAFVIPTGSMAPTLLGAHFDVVCPKCGLAYKETADVSWQLQRGPGNTAALPIGRLGRGELVDSQTVMAPKFRPCPNCGYEIPTDKLSGNPVNLSFPAISDTRYIPWANNGDRILVLKYLYDFVTPKRWDVIVFKEPMEGQDNYIKRLIGRPGETVEVIDGDIYIADAGTDQALVDRHEYPIARKPKSVQDAVWQLVYDNDHYPIDAPTPANKDGDERVNETDRKHWTFKTPWHAVDDAHNDWELRGPSISYAGTTPGTITFAGNDDIRFKYLVNMIGYNAVPDWTRPSAEPSPGTTDVGVKDVHVEFSWKPESAASASVSILVGHPTNQYRFTWNGTGKKLLLERLDDGTFVDLPAAMVEDPGTPQPGAWYKIEMDNADHAAHVYINGKLVMQDLPAWTARQAEALAMDDRHKAEKPSISISVGGASQMTHLKLMHDLYYTHPDNGFGVMGNPATLNADEFFAMGDNSAYSFDSRMWNKVLPALSAANPPIRHGIVPRRLLLGRAFFVYWPAGFRPMNGAAPDLPRLLDPPLVPNTGEMRFIR